VLWREPAIGKVDSALLQARRKRWIGGINI
jgi:hypothetical protein